MSLKKFTTSAAVITGLLAANLSPLATAANAGDGWHRHHDRGYTRSYDGPRHYYGPKKRYAKRHKHDKDIAKGIAIGLGVLAIGAILSSAHR